MLNLNISELITNLFTMLNFELKNNYIFKYLLLSKTTTSFFIYGIIVSFYSHKKYYCM